MSWAAHDPEGWDEVCLLGIKEKMLKEIHLDYEKGISEMAVGFALEILRDARQDSNVYEAWVCLSLWAQKEVSAHEGSYLESKYGSRNDE